MFAIKKQYPRQYHNFSRITNATILMRDMKVRFSPLHTGEIFVLIVLILIQI